MMVDVHLADGRTTFRFARRGQMVTLMCRKPQELGEGDGTGSVWAWVRWHPENPFEPIRLQQLRPASVAFVRQVLPDERDEFLASLPEDQRPVMPRPLAA
jgi:hypothetical protein